MVALERRTVYGTREGDADTDNVLMVNSQVLIIFLCLTN